MQSSFLAMQRTEAQRFVELLASAAAGKPVLLVLGNHDVVNPAWKTHFTAATKSYPNIELPDSTHRIGDIDVVLLQAEYLAADGSVKTEWDSTTFPVPALNQQSAAWLSETLAADADRPAVVVTHCPSHLLPPSSCGFAAHVAAGMEQYRQRLDGLLDQHPRVRLVLSGHIHFNSVKRADNGRLHQSLSSFGEYPCQVRLIEVTDQKITSRMIALADEFESE